jgi:hypothetical protein
MLSENPSISYENVQANPAKPWDYYGLSSIQFTKHPVLAKREAAIKLQKNI